VLNDLFQKRSLLSRTTIQDCVVVSHVKVETLQNAGENFAVNGVASVNRPFQHAERTYESVTFIVRFPLGLHYTENKNN